MDVIALKSANFNGAIAPLGTAITENQLQLMWRISPEPIIALDGDKAGLRAAYSRRDANIQGDFPIFRGAEVYDTGGRLVGNVHDR